MICTQTLEMKIEERILSQCNKLLIDYKKPPARILSEAEAGREVEREIEAGRIAEAEREVETESITERIAGERYDDSMFDRVFPDAETDYPLSDTELAGISDYRLIEVIRKEQIKVFNLDEMMTLNVPEHHVPLLYVCPALGMEPVEYENLQQNCQAYLYPVNLRLVLNRNKTAFPELTITDTESLIREGLKYVLDRSVFLQMDAPRSGYEINSRVIDHVGFTRMTLNGFESPWEVFDYEMGYIIREQATLAANPYN